MDGNGGEEFVDRDPRKLSNGEWRVLTDYRLREIEKRVGAIYRTLQGIVVVVIAAVIVAWLRQGGPTPTTHAIGRFFGL